MDLLRVRFHLHWFPHGRPWIHCLCLKTTRVRGAGRHSRSGPSKLAAADCSESTEAREVFVDCQDRRLISVPTSQTWSKQPKHLLLARNHIKVLRDGAFSGYEGLISLDLQQNEILLVEEGAFQGLTRLTTLLLQHNRLGTLSEEALIPMHNLAYLRLYDNPWNCLCPMDNLIRTLQVPSNRNLGTHARWAIPLRVCHHEIKSLPNIASNIPSDFTMTDGSSLCRCAEPLMLRGRKLKQVNPDLLCKERNSTSIPQEAQKDGTNPLEPVPIRKKPEATTTCHTYLFPQRRMDCSKRGKLTASFYFPKSVWFTVSKSELECNCSWKVRKNTHIYDRELICLWLNITDAQLNWLNFIFSELAKTHICFGKVFFLLLFYCFLNLCMILLHSHLMNNIT